MAPKKQHWWQIYLLRQQADYLGKVEAPDRDAAIKAAVERFEIRNPENQKRLSAQRQARTKTT